MIELHGNINNFYCTNCKKKFNSKYYQKSHKCNNGHDNFEKEYTKCNGTLRPNIVLSGEIPKYLELALFNMYKSDIVLIIGTEMSISPINKLPVMAKEKGAKLVAINKEPIESIANYINYSIYGEDIIDVLEKLNLKDNKEADEIFIISLKKFIKDYFIARDIEDIKNKDAVLITTPYSYIANNIDRKIQIWVDIGSNTWNMKIEKDLANPLVLKKSFKDGEIYTSEIEETYKKYYMYNTVYNLLKNAENIYAYKSEYSINGYIQEGGLYSTILRLIDRGGENID